MTSALILSVTVHGDKPVLRLFSVSAKMSDGSLGFANVPAFDEAHAVKLARASLASIGMHPVEITAKEIAS